MDVLGASRSTLPLTYMGIYFYNLLDAAGLHERGGDPLLHSQADALRGLDADGRRAELQTTTVTTSTPNRDQLSTAAQRSCQPLLFVGSLFWRQTLQDRNLSSLALQTESITSALVADGKVNTMIFPRRSESSSSSSQEQRNENIHQLRTLRGPERPYSSAATGQLAHKLPPTFLVRV